LKILAVLCEIFAEMGGCGSPPSEPSLSQRGAEPAGCHAHLVAEDRGEMALVGEPNLVRDQGEGLVGSSSDDMIYIAVGSPLLRRIAD
jgi:hypothetical protein